MKRTAIITIETFDTGEDTSLQVEFDPPADQKNTSLCEHLAVTAMNAMVAESKRLMTGEEEADRCPKCGSAYATIQYDRKKVS